MLSKEELEVQIAGERPVGEFLFDEQRQCFTTDAEVVCELVELDVNVYRSGEFIYFGGYEYSMEEHEKKTLFGTFDEVEEQLAQEYIEENRFMGYPVIYTNFRATLVAG